MNLQLFGLAEGTDKGDLNHSHNGRSYLDVYDGYFYDFRMRVKRLLEIGVGNGGSLRMWRDFFPNAVIVGLDIDSKASQYAEPDNRILIQIGSQSNVRLLEAMAGQSGGFDIVIDDGSHCTADIITSLSILWPHTRMFYCVEDTDCSYRADWPVLELRTTDAVNRRRDLDKILLKTIANLDRGDPTIQALHIHNMQIIFEKHFE